MAEHLSRLVRWLGLAFQAIYLLTAVVVVVGGFGFVLAILIGGAVGA